jgi:hypothetical protein
MKGYRTSLRKNGKVDSKSNSPYPPITSENNLQIFSNTFNQTNNMNGLNSINIFQFNNTRINQEQENSYEDYSNTFDVPSTYTYGKIFIVLNIKLDTKVC